MCVSRVTAHFEQYEKNDPTSTGELLISKPPCVWNPQTADIKVTNAG